MNLYSNGRLKGAVLLGLASVLWMFGPKVPLDRYFPPKTQTESQVSNDNVASHSTRELAANLVDLTTPVPKDLDRLTSHIVRECLTELDPSFVSQAFSLKDLADHLRNSRTSTTKIEIENLHLVTSEGKELRMMISPSDSTEFDGLEAQMFSVDNEGLPVLEPLPLTLEPGDIDAAKKHFMNLGSLTFSETTYLFKDEPAKIAGKLSYSFDELTGAELSRNGRFLGCAKAISSKSIACRCL